MSMKRVLSYAVLVSLTAAVPVLAAGSPVEIAVRKPHLFGASHGTLVVNDQGVEYRTPDKKDARRWTYDQIKQVQVVTPTRLALRTYEDQGWTHFWTDRTITFEVDKGQVTPEFSAALLASIPRPVMTTVLPSPTGKLRYQVPAKHVRGRRGSEGQLLLFDNALVYQSAQKGASRYWRFGDLASVYLLDRFRMDLLTYEGGGGDTRSFEFQLQSDLPPGFYDTLWAFVNAPAPLRLPTAR